MNESKNGVNASQIKIKNEDLKFVPAGTRCAKCYKLIREGIFQKGFDVGLSFNCKECYLENERRLERLREERNNISSQKEKTSQKLGIKNGE